MNNVINPANEALVLHPYAEDSYLKYAMATVRDRALAQVQDGQKPVQKRILYAMRELGLKAGAKPVKSARVVGDVIGKLHPHGDGAAYDALVRMAQSFMLRYPVIAGEGNFGSRDGDPAAAYRYTECSLAPFADVLLSEIDRGTVDFQPNFDNTTKEPVVLPARLPVLALNGSKGIAVGMASDIPPHNVSEVVAACRALIERPDATDSEVLRFIQGPDLPDGGQIISSREEIELVYSCGRGSLRMRARWVKEDLARGQWQIVITELPYQVCARRVLEQIEALCNPLVKGKTLSAQQAHLKAATLSLLEKATDESDKDSAVRLVLSPRTAKVDPQELLAFLFANTDLEANLTVNLTFLDLQGSPQTRGMPELLRQWCRFRVDTVRRRTEFELAKLNDRIHILEGRQAVYLNVDEVIVTIRESEDPKLALKDRFALSDIQADDILEMRLRQLARLEGIKIERELAGARDEAKQLAALLASESALRREVSLELEQDAAKYISPRRTLIEAAERAGSQTQVARSVVDEPITLLVSRNLWIRARGGHEVDEASLTWKSGDGPLAIVKARTSQTVCVLDSKGRAYSFDASQVPTGRGDGIPLSTLIELQDQAKVVAVLAGPAEVRYLFAGAQGYGFIAQLSALHARPRAGKVFLTLQEGERPVAPVPVDGTPYLAVGTSDSRLLVFPTDEVKSLDKGKGVQLMLTAGAEVVAIVGGQAEPWTLPLQGGSGSITLKGETWAKYCMHRARKGCLLPKGAKLAG